MAKYRKKPVVIEAVRFQLHETPLPFQDQRVCCLGPDGWHVDTLEGKMRISDGDWIIKGVKGEFYPCKPDIFAATYEAVSPEPEPQARASEDHANIW